MGVSVGKKEKKMRVATTSLVELTDDDIDNMSFGSLDFDDVTSSFSQEQSTTTKSTPKIAKGITKMLKKKKRKGSSEKKRKDAIDVSAEEEQDVHGRKTTSSCDWKDVRKEQQRQDQNSPGEKKLLRPPSFTKRSSSPLQFDFEDDDINSFAKQQPPDPDGTTIRAPSIKLEDNNNVDDWFPPINPPQFEISSDVEDVVTEAETETEADGGGGEGRSSRGKAKARKHSSSSKKKHAKSSDSCSKKEKQQDGLDGSRKHKKKVASRKDKHKKDEAEASPTSSQSKKASLPSSARKGGKHKLDGKSPCTSSGKDRNSQRISQDGNDSDEDSSDCGNETDYIRGTKVLMSPPDSMMTKKKQKSKSEGSSAEDLGQGICTSNKKRSGNKHHEESDCDVNDSDTDSGNESDYIRSNEMLSLKKGATKHTMTKKSHSEGSQSLSSSSSHSRSSRRERTAGTNGNGGADCALKKSESIRNLGRETRQRPGAHQARSAGQGNHRDRSRSRSRRSATRGDRGIAMQKSLIRSTSSRSLGNASNGNENSICNGGTEGSSALGSRNNDDDESDNAEEDMDALFRTTAAYSEERQNILEKSRRGPVRAFTLDRLSNLEIEEMQQKAAMKAHRRASCAGNVPAASHSKPHVSSGLDEHLSTKNSTAAACKGAADRRSSCNAGGFNPSSSVDSYISSSASCTGDYKSDKRHHRRESNPQLKSALDSILSDSRKHRKDMTNTSRAASLSFSQSPKRGQLTASLSIPPGTATSDRSLPSEMATDTGGIVMPLAEEKKKGGLVSRIVARRASATIVDV